MLMIGLPIEKNLSLGGFLHVVGNVKIPFFSSWTKALDSGGVLLLKLMTHENLQRN